MTTKEKLNEIYELIKGEEGEIFEKIREILGIEKKKVMKRFEKPTIYEVVKYCKERNNGIDGEAFWYFYESKDWKIGKSAMKNWKMAIATWEKNSQKNGNNDLKTLRDFTNKGDDLI